MRAGEKSNHGGLCTMVPKLRSLFSTSFPRKGQRKQESGKLRLSEISQNQSLHGRFEL